MRAVTWIFGGLAMALAWLLRRRKDSTILRTDCLTYSELIQRVVDNMPDTPYEKAAIVRKSHGAARVFLQLVYLDVDNEVVKDKAGKPCMISISANKLDDELEEAFSDNDVIVFSE